MPLAAVRRCVFESDGDVAADSERACAGPWPRIDRPSSMTAHVVRVSRVAQRIPSPAPSHRVSACCIQSTPHARPSMKNKNKTTKFPVVRP